MIKQYFKQVFYQLKQNKLISCISIIGTALTICMIMIITIIFQIKNADYRPEINRSKTLSIWYCDIDTKQDGNRNTTNTTIALSFIQNVLYPLKSAEAVTAIATDHNPLSVSGNSERISAVIKYTDTDYWKLFDFDFLTGQPFTEVDFQSGIKQAVLREEIARKLFHTTDVVGKEFQIRGITYTVCGVVRDFSKWASSAYGDVYVPYTTQQEWWNAAEQTMGPFICLILAPDGNSFDEIRREVDVNVERFNQNQKEFIISLKQQPYTHFQRLFVTDVNPPRVTEHILRYIVILLVLLLVPAINLSGIILSWMQWRMEEIGIRRAFGATRRQIIGQILNENFVMTLLGGTIGIILSYISMFLMRDWLLNGDRSISLQMVVSPAIFILAFLFCLLLNLLSAGIPAWRTANKNITDALR